MDDMRGKAFGPVRVEKGEFGLDEPLQSRNHRVEIAGEVRRPDREGAARNRARVDAGDGETRLREQFRGQMADLA